MSLVFFEEFPGVEAGFECLLGVNALELKALRYQLAKLFLVAVMVLESLEHDVLSAPTLELLNTYLLLERLK